MTTLTPQQHLESRREVHASQRQHHVTPITPHLHVVTVINNPMRYYTRYRLYRAFAKMVEDSGATLHTVELALRDRHFEVTSPDNPNHIQLRSPEVLWHKENLINVAIARLPQSAEYVAWVDADVIFSRPDWVQETLHQLQIYRVVQMWSHSIDYGPEHQPIAQCGSLFASYLKDRHILKPAIRNARSAAGGPLLPADSAEQRSLVSYDTTGVPPERGAKAPGLMHTGYAWAARRSSISDLGGLGEIGILGSGDRHMAYALLGEVQRSFPLGISKGYVNYWMHWQERAEKHIQRKVGVVNGTIGHVWHGSKLHRHYQDRWKILVEDGFDPDTDICRDMQGVLQFTDADTPRKRKLRDDVIQYFNVRNEDSIDL